MVSKVKVFPISTPYYTLLTSLVDASVCGITFSEFTLAFGLNLPLDYPGVIKYTPYDIKVNRELTHSLNEYLRKNEAKSCADWVSRYIPVLNDTPCNNGLSLRFPTTDLNLLTELVEPDCSDCYYPALASSKIKSETEFNEVWIEQLIGFGAKHGIELISDYRVLWVSGNQKGLDLNGNFVDTPAEPEESWNEYE